MRRAAWAFVLAASSCAAPPQPAPAFLELQRHPRAVVEGRAVDDDGRPAAFLGVRAFAREKDVPWSDLVSTDAQGRFRLTLAAPAQYGFALERAGTTVLTTDACDPSRLRIAVTPGQSRSGLTLVFLRRQWGRILHPLAATAAE